LTRAKKRPVLIAKDQNKYGDFICFQITSQKNQSNILPISESDYKEKSLKINSFVKYDKCFTLNIEIVNKKLTAVDNKLLEKLKEYFCNQL
jgi:hypothetical protein